MREAVDSNFDDSRERNDTRGYVMTVRKGFRPDSVENTRGREARIQRSGQLSTYG